jgi:hypothetical protein
MGNRPCLGERLADEQPAGAGLDRDLDFDLVEALYPIAHGLGLGRDPTAVKFARFGVERVEGDLGLYARRIRLRSP